jgi:hypothetical protein
MLEQDPAVVVQLVGLDTVLWLLTAFSLIENHYRLEDASFYIMVQKIRFSFCFGNMLLLLEFPKS